MLAGTLGRFFLDPDGFPFSKRCSALGVRASFLTECFKRPINPLLDVEAALVGDSGVEGTVGEAVAESDDPVNRFDGLVRVGVAAVETGPCLGELVGALDGCCAAAALGSVGIVEADVNFELLSLRGVAVFSPLEAAGPLRPSGEVLTVGRLP